MTETFNIAAYCRISVDDEKENENTSIENQKSIISDYVSRTFPGSELTFFEDRDRSGYTFAQREGYQRMRPQLLSGRYDILIVKDLSRFSRRNGHGLVELETLRDAGVRIIAIGDSIDYPTNDDWLRIQIYFFVNEMPVTDTSKKVKNVIKRRQEEGKWICSVPYGYVITNSKTGAFAVEPSEAAVVQKVFDLYLEGWGYQKIANYLTEQHIPTPRMNERARIEASGGVYHRKVKDTWSIVTIQGILFNDFYIGTLRQGKYTRKKINGDDVRKDASEHIVFENHHEPIIDYRTFAIAQGMLQKRSTDHYRGVKKYDNIYSGFMVCGDCGSPMFPMSRPGGNDAYRCGTYHRRGRKACSSHFIKVGTLDVLLKGYLQSVRETSAEMMKKLEQSITNEKETLKAQTDAAARLEDLLADAISERAILSRQMAREIMRSPEKEALIETTYETLLGDCDKRIEGLQNQIALTHDKYNTVIRVNRIAKETIAILDNILDKNKLDRNDLEFLLERIFVFEDHIHVKLKSDIESILQSGALPEETEATVNFNSGVINSLHTVIVQRTEKRADKVYDVNVISSGDPLEIYTDTDGEVIFKKYSPIGELGPYTQQYADVLSRTTGLPALLCDRDRIIAAAGISKKQVLERPITRQMEENMEARESYMAGESSQMLEACEGLDRHVAVMVPIIGGGDVMGAVIALCDDAGALPTATQQRVVQVAAGFLGKQMEE